MQMLEPQMDTQIHIDQQLCEKVPIARSLPRPRPCGPCPQPLPSTPKPWPLLLASGVDPGRGPGPGSGPCLGRKEQHLARANVQLRQAPSHSQPSSDGEEGEGGHPRCIISNRLPCANLPIKLTQTNDLVNCTF